MTPDATAVAFGVVADCQYADAATPEGSPRRFRSGVAKLTEAMDVFDARRLAFVVDLGDLLDRDAADLPPLNRALASRRAPVLHVLGNHDLRSFAGDRRAVLAAYGMTAAYYTHRVADVRFVVLDTNETGAVDQPPGSPSWHRQRERLAALLAQGRVNARPWNGGVGAEQLRWLEVQLTAAARARERVVVLAHQPLLPAGDHTVLNAGEVLALLDRFPGVIAYLAGHRHRSDLVERRGCAHLTFEAMVNTDTNAFAVCRVDARRLVVEGFGREISRSLDVRGQAFSR